MRRIVYDGVITEEEFKQDVLVMLYGNNMPKKKEPASENKEVEKENVNEENHLPNHVCDNTKE